MFDQLKNNVRYFIDCIRLVAWANSGKPLNSPQIEIVLETLDGRKMSFEVTDTPEAIDLNGHIFVRMSASEYMEVCPIPMLWLDPDYVEANQVAEAVRDSEPYMITDQKQVEAFFEALRLSERPNIETPSIVVDECLTPKIDPIEPIFSLSVSSEVSIDSAKSRNDFELSAYQLSPLEIEILTMCSDRNKGEKNESLPWE